MNVGLLLLTQENIGNALLRAAQTSVDPIPFNTSVLAINAEAGVDMFVNILRQRVRSLDTGAGVLILVDAQGSSPHRLAQTLLEDNSPVRIITGLNLPMLLSLFRNAQRNLDELANVAIQGGRQGIADGVKTNHAPTPLHHH